MAAQQLGLERPRSICSRRRRSPHGQAPPPRPLIAVAFAVCCCAAVATTQVLPGGGGAPLLLSRSGGPCRNDLNCEPPLWCDVVYTRTCRRDWRGGGPAPSSRRMMRNACWLPHHHLPHPTALLSLNRFHRRLAILPEYKIPQQALPSVRATSHIISPIQEGGACFPSPRRPQDPAAVVLPKAVPHVSALCCRVFPQWTASSASRTESARLGCSVQPMASAGPVRLAPSSCSSPAPAASSRRSCLSASPAHERALPPLVSTRRADQLYGGFCVSNGDCHPSMVQPAAVTASRGGGAGSRS